MNIKSGKTIKDSNVCQGGQYLKYHGYIDAVEIQELTYV